MTLSVPSQNRSARIPILLLALLGAGSAAAQSGLTIADPPPPATELPPLASYAATYDLALVKAAQIEGVRAASGTLSYTLIDRCDGYTIESETDISLAFSNGVANQVVKRFAGWESKDGRRATFRMKIYENGELEDAYTGQVELEADGSGRAVYIGAETTSFDLPPGTVLSTTQLRELIRAGQTGTALVAQTVMDGAFEEGPYRVTGYVAPARGASVPAAAAPPLLAGPYWPVTLAYFPMDEPGEVPEYEIGFHLLANGVIRTMTQDYGSYSLALDLTRIAPREGGC
jgi:hypothetical protein